jgi:hypothetical protein
MRNRILIGTIFSLSAAGLLWALRGSHQRGTTALSSSEKPAVTSLGIVKDANNGTAAKETLAVTGTAPPAAPATTVAEKPQPLAEVPVPFASELKEYEIIKEKVFLSEEEKSLRKSLWANENMLRSLGDYLKSVGTQTETSEKSRNLATDLLLEALHDGKSPVAEKALQDVITDTGIENDKLDPSARQSLAGTKAEVLYNWSAMDPGKAAEMKTWLPGPVSKKIWNNVQQAQSQNLAESATLITGK